MAGTLQLRRHPTAAGEHGVDTSLTKIFVGGLAWETRRETMRHYFAQFGEILEAVVIVDKHTGRSKGYGFVTFKDAEAARRACLDPSPVIDGRRANCNLASEGHQRQPAVPVLPAAILRPIRLPPSLYSRQTYINNQSAAPVWYYNMLSQDNIYQYPYACYSINGGLQQYPYYLGQGTSTPAMIQGYYNPINYNPYPHPNPGSAGLSYGQVVPYPNYWYNATSGLLPLLPATGPNGSASAAGQGAGANGPDQNGSA